MAHKPNISKEYQEISRFLEKVVIDAGVGRASQLPNFEEKGLAQITNDLASVTGQRPQVRRAKKSIAGFKIREGQIVGLKVTLRRRRMVDFFERLVKIILPRVRDFTGLDPKIIDAVGVLNIGFRDQQMFPEINPEKSPLSFSMGITVVPRGRNRATALKKYFELGVPLKKK
ncbi:MAG TPA: 50S ribosomal protein L5 [Candidatus Paceibacterota bacterium]|nr:50S ribosomal protein L5 [Candidatus Paceibacterota bacterium]